MISCDAKLLEGIFSYFTKKFMHVKLIWQTLGDALTHTCSPAGPSMSVLKKKCSSSVGIAPCKFNFDITKGMLGLGIKV
jgi:hypothetical protein